MDWSYTEITAPGTIGFLLLSKVIMPPANCYLFNLPAELKLEILSNLDSKRDLYNVAKTCRWLEDLALKKLYRTIDVDIPSDNSSAWSTGGYLKLRSHVVKVIQEITIRDGIMDTGMPQYHRRRRSDAGNPEAYAAQIVDEIPTNQLKKFSFMHRSPVSFSLLKALKARHGESLKHLSCYEMKAPYASAHALPSNLESLECRSVEDGEALGRLVYASRDTLQTLRIGEERALVNRYRLLRTAFYDTISYPLRAFQSVINLAEIKSLRRLYLTGLDLTPLVPDDIEEALYFTQLEELTVESCSGCPAFLDAMASIFTFAQSDAAPEPKSFPKLETFLFRNEASNAALRDALVRFLNSFSGLRMLSLLVENGSMTERLPALIPTHGATLEKLVLESRIQPRELLRLDTSRPFGMGDYSQQLWEEGINDVCRLCPSLSELSVGFPWNNEMVRIRQSPLPNLKSLKTMQIRNFPERHDLVQMGDYTIKEHATKFVEWTYGHVQGTSKPQLETLSIGPALYESRFKGSNPDRRQAPEFLRTHHFTIDWALTRFGRWGSLLTGVSEKYMEEIRNEKPLGGVFQQVWLK